MMSEFKEPIPHKDYLLNLGEYFLSPGNTIIYQVVSHPFCRLYWQKYNDPDLSEAGKKSLNFVDDLYSDDRVAITPNKTESSWYDTGCPIKGWRRKGPNFPSYFVLVRENHDTIEKTEITLRWIPTKGTLAELTNIKTRASKECLESTQVQSNQNYLQRLQFLQSIP